jgi:hypothetical protein
MYHRRNAAWRPENESAPLTLSWLLQAMEAKHPGISTKPGVQRAANELQAALDTLDPVKARAKARLQGLIPALTDKQQVEVLRYVTCKKLKESQR